MKKIIYIIFALVFISFLTTNGECGGPYGPCPSGVGYEQCFCIGTNKYICSEGGYWDPSPGECDVYQCPTDTSISKTVTTGANIKTVGTDRDPINMAIGEYFFSMPMFNLGGPLPLTYGIYYGSQVDSKRDIFDGFPEMPFSSNHGRYLVHNKTANPVTAFIETGLGKEIAFTKSGSDWTVSMHERYQYQLKEGTNSEYYYLLDPERGLVYTYKRVSSTTSQNVAQLVKVQDRNGNALTYTSSGNDDIISDGKGRQITISFNNVGGKYYVTTVKDQNNRAYTFSYENNPSDNAGKYTLRSITDPMGNITRYSYGGNNWITGVTYPKGNTPYTQTYKSGETRGIVATQTDAYSNQTVITKTSYDPYAQRESQFKITYPDGSSRSFVHDHYARVMKGITDQSGKTASFTSNESGSTPGRDQIQGITDRLGDTTTITYHTESGNIASIRNAKGQTTTYTYTAQNQTFTNALNNEQATFTFYNLTQITYPDGTNETLTYDSYGNARSFTDRSSKLTQYTYNSYGQILTIINPNGGVITNTYNTNGTLASTKDSGTGTTTFDYDVYGRPIAIREADGSTIQIGYNLNDQILTNTDAIGRTRTYTYDANRKLTNIKDRIGKEKQFTNDNMDRVVSITDRVGKTTTYEYDNMERLKKITDPNNIVTEFGYNSRGWRTSTKLGGRQWSYGYDDESVLTTITSPSGYTTTFTTDKLGNVSTIKDPLNNTVSFTRDSLNRVTGITDPLNRQTTLGYDNRGLLTGITKPVIGSTAYSYNDSGYLTRVTDLKGSQWNFTRTNMGRLSRITDPLSRQTNYSYDTKGRLQTVTNPDGSTLTYTYDNNNNPITRTYTGMTAINNTYDEEDRLIGSNDISFSRDDEGRVTSTVQGGIIYDATYNSGGQLQSVTYNNALFAVNYSYNTTTGLLQTISDTLTGTTITFNYDNDNRLIGITRPNNVNGTYTYDNAGRLTRIQEGSIIDIQHTYNAGGEITSSSFTAPLDPANYITSATMTNTYDSASQISSSGYTHDQLGRVTAGGGNTYTWDTASRLTGINNTTMTYNGLGNILTRTESGQTVRYHYNNAVGLSPIMAVKNEATNSYKYFVWTPSGRLIYMIDGGDGNKVYHYHFDHLGSTLALTNSSGTLTDSYAYDPYGKVLGKNGSTQQPFTFVGAWGVRQEGDSGIYHMRARYYDSNTARFISKEPIWPQINSPIALNPYQYSANNPVKYVDVTGLFFNPLDLIRTEDDEDILEKQKKVGFVFSAELTIADIEELLKEDQIDFIKLAIKRLGAEDARKLFKGAGKLKLLDDLGFKLEQAVGKRETAKKGYSGTKPPQPKVVMLGKRMKNVGDIHRHLVSTGAIQFNNGGASNILFGGKGGGLDTLSGGSGDDTLSGSTNSLYSSSYQNLQIGPAGVLLLGGNGNDRILGGDPYSDIISREPFFSIR